MSIADGCINDVITPTSSIDDFNYYIAQTGSTTVPSPTYNQDQDTCGTTWSLVRVVNGADQTLNTKESQYLQLQADGSIVVNAGSDYDIVDETWTLKLTITSDESL